MRPSLRAAVLCTFLASSLIATVAETNDRTDLLDLAAVDSGVDVSALDEILRGKEQRVLRWSEAPRLVVLTSVMQFATDGANHVATNETMSEREADALVADLTTGLAFLSDGRYTRFANVRLDVVPVGATAQQSQFGAIVVGRYVDMRKRANTLGLGGRRWTKEGRITCGSILLDSDYDRTSDVRHLLRTHELGHALGYNHVTSLASIMNPRIGSEPTEFDRQAARIAFGLLVTR